MRSGLDPEYGEGGQNVDYDNFRLGWQGGLARTDEAARMAALRAPAIVLTIERGGETMEVRMTLD